MHGYISRYIYVNNAGRICMSRCRSRYALYLYTICRVRVHVSRVGTRLSYCRCDSAECMESHLGVIESLKNLSI